MSEALKNVVRRIQDRIASEERELGRGAAKDWPDYKRREGRIQGMAAAIGEIDAVLEIIKRGGLSED